MRYRLTVVGGHDETRSVVLDRILAAHLSVASLDLASLNNRRTTNWDLVFAREDETVGEQMFARWVAEPPRQPPYPMGALLAVEAR